MFTLIDESDESDGDGEQLDHTTSNNGRHDVQSHVISR